MRTVNTPLDTAEIDRLADMLSAQAAEGEALIRREPVRIEAVEVTHSLDMQFVGQTHLLQVPLASPTMTRGDIRAAFEDVYFNRFRVRLPETGAQIVNVNTCVTGRRPEVDLGGLIDNAARAGSVAAAQTGSRPVWFDGGGGRSGWRDTPVYAREKLPLDARLSGPAILEQMDTTILIEPRDSAVSDDDGNILVKVGGRHEA